MTSSSNLILQHYIKLTEFLGKALGPDYEVALHDLTRKDRSIIAIANNYISGREVGAPLTNMALSSLRDKSYEHTDYHLHYYSINVNGKDLRSCLVISVGRQEGSGQDEQVSVQGDDLTMLNGE